jgi:hypothetical protein
LGTPLVCGKILRGFDEQRGYIPPSARASIYLGLGKDEKVYEWLERAFRERDPMTPWIKTLPGYDRPRQDQRFQDPLRRMGLE